MKKLIIILLLLFPLTTFASIEDDINALRPCKLTIDKHLINTSRYKVKDMLLNNYFAHNNPVGKNVGDIFNLFHINTEWAGEILASGYTNKEVVEAWFYSPSHKRIMLDKDFKKVGCYSEQEYITCHFSN